MKPSEHLDLTPKGRNETFSFMQDKIESYFEKVPGLKVANTVSREEVLSYLAAIDFNQPQSSTEAIDFVCRGLDKYQVHTPHPSYFGLFNPAATAMGVVADALVAAYNPQLAAWSHSPLANEIENLLIKEFGKIFFQGRDVDGTLTSGGAEANHTALLAALSHHFPTFQSRGLQSIPEKPVFYISAESHHSFLKAARFCGLGNDSVKIVPVDNSFRMSTDALRKQVHDDIADGYHPFMLVATVGTTSCGAIDSLEEINLIAKENGLWFHIDAAWGGAIGLLTEYTNFLSGLSLADSISFDAHKWLSVPMGAGMFFTSHSSIMKQAFGIETAYMPVKNSDEVINPFHHSIQWSRRFIGLKLFLSLAVAGWEGYREVIRNMIQMGIYLKDCLIKDGWNIINDTILPVVCFSQVQNPNLQAQSKSEEICKKVVATGDVWISTTILDEKIPVLRACITNYRTEKANIEKLVLLLRDARNAS